MDPYIGTVIYYVNRHISNDLNTFLIAIILKTVPLLKEEILEERLLFNRIKKLILGGPQGHRLSIPYLMWPFAPDLSMKMRFQGHKKCEIIEPLCMLCTELFILVGLLSPLETFKRLMKNLLFVRHNTSIIHPLF